MVFESMLVDILNRYLRPYVKKLDPSQIKVGVWKGHARLEKLELKEDLFAEADLDLPVEIKNSYIGKLELKIPWKSLSKDPLYVTIDEVYVVVGPKIETRYDAEKDLKRRRKEKEKKIEKFEESAKKRKKKQKEEKKSKKSKKNKDADKPDSFTEKLVTNLLKNMEVKVRDIHVRYEDSTPSRHGTLAAGVTLHSLELKSTDENWKPSFVKETATIIFKLLELNCLGMYWNTYTTKMAELPQLQMANEMREGIARPVLAPPPTIEYLLKPVSASARLKLSLKPGADMNVPQVTMDVHFEDIVASVHETQFKSLMNTVETFDRHVVNQKFLKYRPEVGVREGAREWWRYAISAVREEEVKRKLEMWSWKHMQQHRATFKQYRDKYREKVKSLSPSSSLLQQIQELEDKLDWFNVVVARREAKRDKSKTKKLPAAASPMASITKATPPVTPSQESPPTLLTPAQKLPPTSSENLTPSTEPPVKKKGGKSAADKKGGEKKEEKKKKGLFANFRKKLKSGGKSDEEKKGEEKKKGEERKSEKGKGGGGKVEGASNGGASVMVEGKEQEEEREERERQEFYKAIGYSEDEEFVEFPKEYVAHRILVSLNSLTVELSGKKQLATLVANRVAASVLNRPSSKSVSVSASVAALEMMGIPHGPDPTIILSTATSDLSTPLLNFQLELNPLISDIDMELSASLQPLQITYDADTIDGLIAAFRVRQNIHLQELTTAASATVEDLRTQTSTGFQNALKSKKQMRLDVTLHSPYLVLPQGGYLSPQSSLLVIDLGTLSMSGSTKGHLQEQCELPDQSASDRLSRYYDNFTLKLEGMQVMVAKPGDDWHQAKSQGSSSLHILNPTGLQLQLKQSIVKKDAYLPSVRIEADIPGFEVSVSDEKLVTILNIVTSLQLPPPSLTNTTTYYDNIPVPTLARPASLTGMADDMDIVSLSSYLEEEEEEDTHSLTSAISATISEGDGEQDQDARAVERIFTDAEIKVVIRKIGVSLTQVVKETRTATSAVHPTHRKLLDISVEQMKADVIDRNWDAQGSVTIGNISILDHISLDSTGSPTDLLKTRGLSDGNFISAKFVTVTQVGKAFAEKYTGFKNSVSAQLSLVELRLERRTIAKLLELGLALKPAMEKSALAVEEADTVHVATPTSALATPSSSTHATIAAPAINPHDFDDIGEKKPKDFHFDVLFEGIGLHLAHQQLAVVYTEVSGFSVKGKTEEGVLSVAASMEDVLVQDPHPTAQNNKIVSRTDTEKSMIELQVTEYKHSPQERNSQDLAWVDTALRAEIQRIKVQLDTSFLDRFLEFAQHLKINQDALQIAAQATAGTATAAATAIRETEKTAHRVKLDIKLHAPFIVLPYSIRNTRGKITIDLGDFHIQNRFVHGNSLFTGPLDTIGVKEGAATFDLMEIHSTAIQIHRASSHTGSDSRETTESTSIILEPMQFTASVTRNLGNPSLVLPNVDVELPLGIVKFHLHEEDVKALITIALATTRVAQVLSPPPKTESEVNKGTPEQPSPRPHSKSSPRSHSKSSPRSHSKSVRESRPLTLARMDSVVEVTEVRIQASLHFVSLDFETKRGPLFQALSSGVKAKVGVYKEMVQVKASVESLCVTDSTSGDGQRKIVSLAENTDKASSLELKLDTRAERDHLQPLGEVKTTIAQVRLVLLAPFVQQLLEFVQRLKGVNTELVANATKLGKGGAQAIHSKAWDKYLSVDVEVHAPVLLLPVSEASPQAFMIDLGAVTVQNMMIPLDGDAGIDAYGINLSSLKASRVLLDVEGDYSVLCERMLFQPFHIQLAVERNLCSAWYSKRPTISLNCQMGEFKLLVGQEDLQQLIMLGKNFGERLSRALDKGSGGAEVREAIMEGLTAEEEGEGNGVTEGTGGEEAEVTEMVKVVSSLSCFELKLFKDEPPLSVGNPDSAVVPDSYALASLQLLQMELSVSVQSNQEVELQASLRDMALCDEQPDQKQKKTGTRVIQHYTSNPLMAYTGKLDTPLVKISYLLREGQHIVVLTAENILVLSDIQFLTTLSDHFQAILGKKEVELPSPESSIDDSIMSGGSSEAEEDRAVRPARPLPRLKIEASIKNVRVAIVEDVDDPQALTLKVSTAYLHVQLTEKNKQASVNVADLSIAASNFYNLEQVNKWILLPCFMQLTMTGPLDEPAMEINATVEPISLTLSPSVIRLIIHAVTSLVPKKETKRKPAPHDLWHKKSIEDHGFWFLKPVPLHKARTETFMKTVQKGEILSLGVECVEVILESEGTQRSRGYPVLACNVTALVQVSEWTGDLAVSADVHCEASYYNEHLSVWEPLLEPLEGPKTGKLETWCLKAEVKKTSPNKLVVSEGESGPMDDALFSVSLSAESPLQLTLTKTSLELLKALAKAYTKEYERKLEISADVQTLTGAPFTVVNKLGGTVGVFIQPGPSLKLRDKKATAKLGLDGTADLWFIREQGRKSYASLLTKPGDEEHTVNLAIVNFKVLKDVVINNPGCYYYTLEFNKPSPKPVHYGIVVEVAVTGTKKTITIRSPVRFHNHLQLEVEIFSAPEMTRDKRTCVATVAPEECYAVPVELAHKCVFYVTPAGFSLEPMGPPIAWFEKPGGRYADSRCRIQGETEPCHYIRVLHEEESYGIRKNLPTEDFAHHMFHLHPPLLLQNLLPFTITTADMDSGCPLSMIEPGQFIHYHEVTPDLEPGITICVTQPTGNSLMGKLKLSKKPKKYSKFAASANGTTVVISALIDDFGYHKVSIFSPYWMLNKTGLNIDYLVDGKAIKHPTDKSLVLLSTSNPKNDIQISTTTPQGKHTDWTLKFSLNAVGTSGNFPARLGQNTYIFGVAVVLSQFTLTKIVTISPYYVLVNETEVFLSVAEDATPNDKTSLPPGELVPFWPLSDGNRMVVTTDTDENKVVFNYKTPDTVCLKFENELKAVCVDVQESESAIITTFTPYYPGCVPVQIVNHFPDTAIKFQQETKSALTPMYMLEPGETMFYTWDNPLGRRKLRWGLVGARVKEAKPINVNKDDQQTIYIRGGIGSQSSISASLLSPEGTIATPPPIPGMTDSWLDVDESFSERLVTADDDSSDTSSLSSYSSTSASLPPGGSLTTSVTGTLATDGGKNSGSSRAYWKSFINGIQRVVLFTPYIEAIDRIKAVGSYSQPQLELSLSLRAVGISLVDNRNKRELAYIAVTQSGVIWQVEKARKKWKTLNNTIIALLEGAHLKKEMDVKYKNLAVNLATMQMYSPVKGKLRRTHHDGVYAKFTMSERDYSINAKVGYVQVDNQLPFSVYPQVLYPLPPPPTVASNTEPKPFAEASIILRKKDDQSNVQHFKYVHVLVQKMAVNADLGFLLALVTFFSPGDPDPQLESEYVKSDIEESKKTLKDTLVPAISKDLESSKILFDVLHIAPIKIVLSFTVRSVGKNKEGENTVGDRVLELFLHSLGAILTSVQDTEMKFSLFHMEYKMKTGRGLVEKLVKHYRTQALVELYTLVLGLDVLGNPVNIVRGVVGGTIDLFYEPIKGSVLGPEEFIEGLGIGLRSFVGGTVGGLTGAGAKITGAVGDVFAKLTFDEQFQDKRQQQKTRPPKLGSKFGGFAKNVFQGVTGVVAQPVKGAQKEGVAGFFKGTGKGLVGLIVRPTGGLIDLTSGTLDFVTRKTQVGSIEINDIRPPRFIGRDGVVRPYSPSKAIGTALLHAVDEGKYVNQFYYGHIQLSKKLIVLVLDRSIMLIEKHMLRDVLGEGGWHSQGCVRFKHFSSPVSVQGTNVILHYKPGEEKSLRNINVSTEKTAHEVADLINQMYALFCKEF